MILKVQGLHICLLVLREWVHWLIVLFSLCLRDRFVIFQSTLIWKFLFIYFVFSQHESHKFVCVLDDYYRLKLRRSDQFKECYRGSEHYSICQAPSVEALVRENMTWQLGSTRRRNPLLCRLMYATTYSSSITSCHIFS